MWLVMVVVMVTLAGTASPLSCEEAHWKCAYRTGCGHALQNYVAGCSEVLQGPPPTRCPEICKYSLIALTSTDEGKELMNCSCSDDYCEDQKRRPEICRSEVVKSFNEPVVSCRVAQSICAADALCSTALEYYNQYCHAMFDGRKCTKRCNNSINILRRQKQAEKLNRCKCDGLEDYDCPGIQRNMEKLCFHRHAHHPHNATDKHLHHPHNATDKHLVTVPPPPPPPEDIGDRAPSHRLAFAAVAVCALVSLVT